MAVDKIGYEADWAARMVRRLMYQFKRLPNMAALAGLYGKQFQDLEDAFQTLRLLPSIDDVGGVNLDVIGRIVGEGRAGDADEDYRPRLRARVAANRSNGTPAAIYTVMRKLHANEQFAMVLMRYRIAALALRLHTPISAAMAEASRRFLGDSKVAGVRGYLEWQEQPDDETFTFAVAGQLQGSVSIGGLLLSVDAASGPLFGNSPTLIINPLAADEETIVGTRVSPTQFSVSGFAQNHADQSLVLWDNDLAPPGLGWGDSTDATAGGELAGAAVA